MEQLAKHLPGFTYAKEKGGFKAWLRTMANNKIRDFYKKPKLANPASKDYDRPQEREPTPDDAWESAWLKQHVRYCLDQIKHDVAQKTFDAFHYYAIQGWPVEKVSEVLDMSANQIYVAKSRVAERLRAKLKEVLTELE
jgi:RNA polymerase sigma-70 factor (ECF subfamily)